MEFQFLIFQALKVMENGQITTMFMEFQFLIKIVICVLYYSVLYHFPILTETMSVLDFPPGFLTFCFMESHEFEVEKVTESHGILTVRKCKNPV